MELTTEEKSKNVIKNLAPYAGCVLVGYLLAKRKFNVEPIVEAAAFPTQFAMLTKDLGEVFMSDGSSWLVMTGQAVKN